MEYAEGQTAARLGAPAPPMEARFPRGSRLSRPRTFGAWARVLTTLTGAANGARTFGGICRSRGGGGNEGADSKGLLITPKVYCRLDLMAMVR